MVMFDDVDHAPYAGLMLVFGEGSFKWPVRCLACEGAQRRLLFRRPRGQGGEGRLPALVPMRTGAGVIGGWGWFVCVLGRGGGDS